MSGVNSGRTYIAGKYGLELDGVKAGWVQSVEGGHATSEVVVEKMGPDHLSRKHLAGVKYEDISISCATGMSKAFYQWMQDSFEHKHSRKNGAIVTANYNFEEMSRLTFTNALITEIGFPALDASSKDAAKMTIKCAPEYTRYELKKGGKIAGKFENDAKTQKKWLPSNFRLKIDGLDDACKFVNKVEAIVVKQKVVDNPQGEVRDYQKEAANLEIPNLVITFAESHSDAFLKWHEDFVIKGNNGQDKEKGGSLEYLTPNLQEVLFTISFFNLGIFKLTPEKVEAQSEQIRRVKAEMYCEDLKFEYKAAWA